LPPTGQKVKPAQFGAGFYLWLTILAHLALWLAQGPTGAKVMNYDHDQNMLIRARLLDLLDALRMTMFEANPLQFLLRLEQIRDYSARHGLGAVAEIAATFETALQKLGTNGGGVTVIDNFTAILQDAIGVAHSHPSASEAMLASVAIRLRN
jgi:hypothetical protein